MKCLITCFKQQLTLSSDVHQQHCTSTLLVSPRIFRQISHHQQRPHLNERVNSPLCTMSMGTGFHPVTRDNTLVINSVEGAVTLTHIHEKHCRAVRRDKLGQNGRHVPSPPWVLWMFSIESSPLNSRTIIGIIWWSVDIVVSGWQTGGEDTSSPVTKINFPGFAVWWKEGRRSLKTSLRK